MQRKIICSCQEEKSFMKQITALFLFSLFFFSACDKNTHENGKVNIRIQNATSSILEDVKVGTTAYGNITTGMTTSYVVAATPVYAGYCNFRINNLESGAGYGVCGTPPPPEFAPGYYTFKVEPTTQSYFNVLVTKD